jgi:caffeoyl-CoA O-methyltransferase
VSGAADPGLSAGEKFLPMTGELYAYLVERGAPRDDLLRRLAAETESLGSISVMQTAPEQGALMTILVRAMGARRALEVGTFTGYGSISIARGLDSGGTLVTCEVEEEFAEIASRWFGEAGLDDVIDLRLGPAIETLRGLGDGEFDFAYIDADKPGYPDYYEECLRLLRPGGLIMVDNVLFSGRVLEPEGESAEAIAALNERIAGDDRVEAAMLGISDGVTLAIKR